MRTLENQLQSLHRPRLLSRAAKNGMNTYLRKRDLKRILIGEVPQNSCDIIHKLLNNECFIENERRAGSPGYSIVKHVEILTAIAAEGQRFLATKSPVKYKKMQSSKREPHLAQQTLATDYMNESGMDSFFCAT